MLQLRHNDVVADGTQDPSGFMSRNNAPIQGYRPWVFSEDAPSKLQSSEQDLAARLQGMEGGGVERHRVGSVSAVGPMALAMAVASLESRRSAGGEASTP